MVRSFIKKLLSAPLSDTAKMLEQASSFGRFRPHDFTFRGMRLSVTDFPSAAWQLKEFFDDGRMNFKADTGSPVIFDCGSNVGISVLYYKKLYPNAVIRAFEPDPKVFACLRKNLSANNITGVELNESAVWIRNEKLQFGSEGADGGSVFYEGNKITVDAKRLKDLLQAEKSIDLLKMDIEGAEVDVLLDCADELKKVKNLFVEYHSWAANPQELDKLLKLLSDNGFRYYIHSIGEVLKQPFISQRFSNGMDIQLDIHAINGGTKK
jgi:FkbM family methyltransferase